MSEWVELKSCPFCGEKPKHIVNTQSFGKNYGSRTTYIGIGCVNKSCLIAPRFNATNEQREDSINIWNTRTPERK